MGRARRIPIRLICWLLLCGGLVALVFRSRTTSDVLALYARNGTIQGVMSHRGRLVLAFTTLPFGSDKAWTRDFAAVPVDEGQALYDIAFGNWDRKREFAGFGWVQSSIGDLIDPAAAHVTLTLPTWFGATLAGLPVLLHVRRMLRQKRRREGGKCLHCGYDLRGTNGERCPECGSMPGENSCVHTSPDGRTRFLAINAVLTLLLIVLSITAYRLWSSPPPYVAVPARTIATSVRVKNVDFDAALQADWAAALGESAHVPVSEPDSGVGPINGKIRDASLASALAAITVAIGEPQSRISPRSGGLVVQWDPVLSQATPALVIRMYDVGDLLTRIPSDKWPSTEDGLYRSQSGWRSGMMVAGADSQWIYSWRGDELLSLLRLIEAMEPASWDPRQAAPTSALPSTLPTGPMIRCWNHWLIISQTPEAHDRIRRLIEKLSEAAKGQPPVPEVVIRQTLIF